MTPATFTSAAQAEAADPFAAAPGSQTSEFKTTVLAQFVSSVIAIVALFSPGFDIDSTTQAVIVGFAGSTLTLSQMMYAWSRSRVKVASAEATAAVATAPSAITNVEQVQNLTATANATGALQPNGGAE